MNGLVDSWLHCWCLWVGAQVSVLGDHYSETFQFLERIYIEFSFFKFNFICFHWRLITLQYCIGSATHQHESTRCILNFPVSIALPPLCLVLPNSELLCVHFLLRKKESPISCYKRIEVFGRMRLLTSSMSRLSTKSCV